MQRSDQVEERLARFPVCRRQESWRIARPGSAGKVRHDASGGEADGYPSRGVHAVARITVCHMGSTPPGSDPREGERGGKHPRAEAGREAGICDQVEAVESRGARERRVHVKSTRPEDALGASGSSVLPRRE